MEPTPEELQKVGQILYDWQAALERRAELRKLCDEHDVVLRDIIARGLAAGIGFVDARLVNRT